MLRVARFYGVPPWELERAAQDDPRALRWLLLEPSLSDYEAAVRRREASR